MIPIYVDGQALGTIWIVSHDEDRQFDAEDVRVMVSLAQFAGASLHLMNSPAASPETEGPETGREAVWKNYLHRIGRNDQRALDALFQEAKPLVFSTCLRILGFAADADEVTGDVFAKIWSSGYRYDESRGNALGWIVSITRNLAFDHLRSRTRAGQTPAALYAECSSVADSESGLLLAERAEGLRIALGALPWAQRRVIELSYFRGLSHADIAEHLGEPLGTIKTRIRTGLIRLRSLLAAVR